MGLFCILQVSKFSVHSDSSNVRVSAWINVRIFVVVLLSFLLFLSPSLCVRVKGRPQKFNFKSRMYFKVWFSRYLRAGESNSFSPGASSASQLLSKGQI